MPPGFETETLTFSYSLTEEDATTGLLPQDLDGSTSPVYCLSSELCYIHNRNNRAVSLAPGPITDPQIVVDTSKPAVQAIWTNKTTSPYDGIYTIGEEILIKLKWTKPVQISSRNPRLILNVTTDSSDVRYALFDEIRSRQESSSGDVFVFVYTVAAGERASDLTFVGPEIDKYFGLSRIYRSASTLTTEVDYTLPNPYNPQPLANTAGGRESR